MPRRLFLVFLSPLTISVSSANQAVWSCEQNKDSKEWVCVGEKKPAVKTVQPVVAEPAEKNKVPSITESAKVIEPVKTMQPALPEPGEKNAAPVKPEPAEIMRTERPEAVPVIKPPPVIQSKPVASPQPAAPVVAQEKQPIVAEPVKSVQPGTLPAPQNQLSDKQARPQGWSCDANKEEGNWNCQLVGADTKGAAQPVATEEESGFSLFNPAFDHQQEQTFGALKSQLKYDPWENCSFIGTGTNRGFVPGANLRETSPLDVKSNYSEIFENEIGSYLGNVEMSRADQRASSRSANYDSVSEVLDLHGDVYYSEDELALHSDSATLKLATDQAKLRGVQFITPSTPLRGQADVVYRDSKSFSRYKKVAFTSCRPGNQDWVIHASDLKMNKVSGKGTVKNAWIEFKSVPVLYTPYLSFPIDNRRLSGFLAPSFGHTRLSGFNISAPYYWNIAPNYDATFYPRYLTERGPLLAGNFRYLAPQSRGSVAAEFMPHDQLLDKARYLGSIKNTSFLTPGISSNLDLNYVSDKTYFAELGNALSFANYNYLRSTADVNYIHPGVYFSSRIENYQSISTTNGITTTSANGATKTTNVPLPYRKLPQVNLNLDHAFHFMPLYTAMENEYIYFQHSDQINGQRLNTKPSVSIPLQTSSAFFTPKLSLQHTQYFLSNQIQGTQTPNSISRTLPIFSADSGLFFEKGLSIANAPYLHTLEPRLFYLYIPYRNQNDIPLFDTAQYDFQYGTMFRENSFSGVDRIQDANQITTALTTRLVDDKAGLERLKLSIGEIFYFRDRRVTAPAVPVQTGNFSNVVTELSSELTHQLSLNTGLQWNPQQNDIERGKAALHFSTEDNKIFNIGYLYRKNPLIPDRSNDIINSDVSFRWPIYDNWYAMGRWQYSLLYNTTQDSFFGVEKENCCWRFRVLGRRYINNLANIDVSSIVSNTSQVISGTAQNGVFFEIELKGLGGLGDDLDRFFEQAIYGYRKKRK
ncbi:MAG: LPS assembly protein LptD [Methylococcales bacterium]|nr:LPS assembly protein LptD [Methylococcales bacterium]